MPDLPERLLKDVVWMLRPMLYVDREEFAAAVRDYHVRILGNDDEGGIVSRQRFTDLLQIVLRDAIPKAPNHGAAEDMTPLPHHHIMGQGDPGADNGCGTNPGSCANNGAGANYRLFPDHSTGLHNHLCTDAGIVCNGRRRVHHRRGMNARRRNGGGVKPMTEPSIAEVGVVE